MSSGSSDRRTSEIRCAPYLCCCVLPQSPSFTEQHNVCKMFSHFFAPSAAECRALCCLTTITINRSRGHTYTRMRSSERINSRYSMGRACLGNNLPLIISQRNGASSEYVPQPRRHQAQHTRPATGHRCTHTQTHTHTLAASQASRSVRACVCCVPVVPVIGQWEKLSSN